MPFSSLRERIEKDSRFDLSKIEKAFAMAQEAHGDQKRHSGAPFISHPVAMAEIGFEMGGDEESIIAGLLHDTVEDTKLSLGKIKKEFGKDIAFIIDGLTKLKTTLKTDGAEEKQAKNLRKIFEFMADDLRIVVLKIADRLHNMRTLGAVPVMKQMEKAIETMEVYVPLTKILGLWEIKKEMEDLAFSYLDPKKYKSLVQHRKKFRSYHLHDFKNAAQILQSNLSDFSIPAKVQIDLKGIHEIHRDAERSEVIETEYQRIAILTIRLPDEVDCFQTLEKIHSFWRPLYYNLKDYISNPKGNYYRALHTSVIGPRGLFLKIRILTEGMYQSASYGVLPQLFDPTRKNKKFPTPVWLNDILTMSRTEKNNKIFLEELKVGILGKKIFVMKKDGAMVGLPEKETGIGFGILTGMDLSKKWTLKLNGETCLLKSKLNPGDFLEIKESEDMGEEPHCLWLLYCKTYSARLRLREYLQTIPKEKADHFGSEALLRELERDGRGDFSAISDYIKKKALRKFDCPSFDILLRRIGRGKLNPHEVYRALFKPIYEENSGDCFRVLLRARQEKPGLLYEILGVFHRYHCSLLKIEGTSSEIKDENKVEKIETEFEIGFRILEKHQLYPLCLELEQIQKVESCVVLPCDCV